MEFFAKGKRGLIYKEGKDIIKVRNPKSTAINRIENEAKWLQILNKKNIGPKFKSFTEGRLRMEFIDGLPILDYCTRATKKERIKVLQDLLNQCYIMDQLQVNKFEMTRPVKHVLIRKGKAILLDFERCKKTEHPKNITQVCQFISRYFKIPEILPKAKAYKQSYSLQKFKEIQQCVTNIT